MFPAEFDRNLKVEDTVVANIQLLGITVNRFKRGIAAVVAGIATVMLASCGGGGTQGGNPADAGSLALVPGSGTLYALVPYTFTINGGRGPFQVVSDQVTILPLNFTTSERQFTVTPLETGVVDVGQDPNQVPTRKTNVTVRDSSGTQISVSFDVAQSFYTGYSLSLSTFVPCVQGTASSSTAAVQACAGSDSIIQLVPVSSGVRWPNRQARLSVSYGQFAFITDSTGITGPNVTVTADSTGVISARLRALPNVPTQYAQFRLTDVPTGAYRDFNFIITNAAGSLALSTLPSDITLQGANTATCGTGAVNIFVFGGRPPYAMSTTFPQQIQISPASLQNSGEAFSALMSNPNFCLNPGNIVVTDATGAFTTVKVTTSAGTTAPILPLRVAPSSICVPDTGSGVVLVSGGNDSKVVNSSNPALAAAVPTTGAGSFTVTVNAGGAGGAAGTLVTLTVSDGGTTATVNVTRKTTCP